MEASTKKICYTAITGFYDMLIDPTVVTEEWRYICFTDNKDLKSNIWEILPIPVELCGLTNVKKQRLLKIMPHRYLPFYNECIWVDGNITIQCNLNAFKEEFCKGDICTVNHPERNCIYDECDAVVKHNRDTSENVEEIMTKLKDSGYPEHNGLGETGLLYRKNNEAVKRMCDEWGLQMLINTTHRDQLTFNYAAWKTKETIHYLPSDIVRNGKLFKLNEHTYTNNKKKREDAQIFVLCYKSVDYNIPDNSLYTPLQCGADVFKDRNLYPLKDNVGDNISERNMFYAEVTGTYFL